MDETIGSRVSRIISGSFNAMADAVEGAMPESIIQDSIREVDDMLDEIRIDLSRGVAAKHLISKKLISLNQSHENLSFKVNKAVEQQKYDLAEISVEKQMDIEAQIPVLESALTEYSEQEQKLERYMQALQAKKREMESTLRLLMATQRQNKLNSVAGITNVKKNRCSANQAFQRVFATSGMDEATLLFDMKQSTKLEELEELSRISRLKERIEHIKKNIKR